MFISISGYCLLLYSSPCSVIYLFLFLIINPFLSFILFHLHVTWTVTYFCLYLPRFSLLWFLTALTQLLQSTVLSGFNHWYLIPFLIPFHFLFHSLLSQSKLTFSSSLHLVFVFLYQYSHSSLVLSALFLGTSYFVFVLSFYSASPWNLNPLSSLNYSTDFHSIWVHQTHWRAAISLWVPPQTCKII